jgi:hypothetical protein
VNRAFKKNHLLALFGKVDTLILWNNIVRCEFKLEVTIGLFGKLDLLSVLRVFAGVHSLFLFELLNLLFAELSLEFALLTLLLALSFVLLNSCLLLSALSLAQSTCGSLCSCSILGILVLLAR